MERNYQSPGKSSSPVNLEEHRLLRELARHIAEARVSEVPLWPDLLDGLNELMEADPSITVHDVQRALEIVLSYVTAEIADDWVDWPAAGAAT
jgi:hypothetical protein